MPSLYEHKFEFVVMLGSSWSPKESQGFSKVWRSHGSVLWTFYGLHQPF